MTVEIKVPALGESVTEATVGQWFKKPGDHVEIDEPLVELETDKVTVEVPAPSSGVLQDIKVTEGETVNIGTLLGTIAQGDNATQVKSVSKPEKSNNQSAPKQESQTLAAAPENAPSVKQAAMPPSPAARKALAESNLKAEDIKGTGRRGQILKPDVTAAKATSSPKAQKPSILSKTAVARTAPEEVFPVPSSEMRAPTFPVDTAREERVKMSRLRQTIARRLKDAQNTAAILTTFNDVDMSAVMDMRKQYKELFLKRHNIKLGFMGFFVKACLQALKEIPAVNAEIDGADIVYKNYYNIGVAVGTDKGLVVPVIHDAERLSIAQIEAEIAEYGKRARDGRLGIQDMQGGTFTITNGGVFGSMLSTPILNAPQSGILGMHRIEDRPVALNGEVVVRPMMYLALSYDHRIVDGKEAVTFLVRVKECLEDPQRFLLDL